LKNGAESKVCTALQDFSRHGEFDTGHTGIGFGAASAVAMCWRSTDFYCAVGYVLSTRTARTVGIIFEFL
jgi:hypothetical protein